MQLDIGGITNDDLLDQLKTDLQPIIEITNTRSVSFRSAEPHSLLQLLSNAIEWIHPLKVAATIFLSQLAKEAATDFWKNKKKIAMLLKDASVKPIKIFASSISKSLKTSKQHKTRFSVGLSIPDDYFGTALTFLEEDEEEIAWIISNFVIRAEQIENAVREEMSGVNKPLGRVFLTIQPDGGFLLQWMDGDKLERHERKIK
jgi:hypothetical protein